MKVMIQNSIFFPDVIGGAEMSTFLLAGHLASQGIEVDALATTGRRDGYRGLSTRPLGGTRGQVYESASAGYRDIYSPSGPVPRANLLVRGAHHFAGVYSARWHHLAREALQRSRPDVLHTNILVGMTSGVWRAARDLGIPIVHTLRDYYLLCPRTTLLRSDGSFCRNAPLPCRVLRSLKLRTSDNVDFVTAPSKFVLDKHFESGAFDGVRHGVVPNACESPAGGAAGSGEATGVRGLYAGQLDAHKGVPELLEALQRLVDSGDADDCGFDFAGAGPLAGEVAEFCDRHPERFRYHGMVAGGAKARLFAGAAFLVVPSLWEEPFGRTIIEGFAVGLPAIASNRGGIPEVVDDGVNGTVIEVTPATLADALRAYFHDDDLRRRHAAAAAGVAHDFSLGRQARSFLDIYNSFI